MTLGVTLIAGMLFGLALAAPPGPMNAIIAEESVLRGWTAGVRAGLGAMTADVVFFAMALIGVVSVVGRFPTVRGVMIGFGGLLMLYFAYGALLGARATFRSDGGPDMDSKGFSKASVLALTNPYQILFWLTIGVGLLRPGELDIFSHLPATTQQVIDLSGAVAVQTGSAALVLGFFGGILIWVIVYPAALVVAERRIEAFAPLISGLSAIILASFGLIFLVDAVGYIR